VVETAIREAHHPGRTTSSMAKAIMVSIRVCRLSTSIPREKYVALAFHAFVLTDAQYAEVADLTMPEWNPCRNGDAIHEVPLVR